MTNAADNEEALRIRRLARAYAVARQFLLLLLAAGAVGSASAWRPGAFLMLGAVSGYLLIDLALGLAAYRHVMTRPWPKVLPLDDDDDS